MKIVDEFKEFIARGNVMDMAVGIIVGGAFTAIVNSLVTNPGTTDQYIDLGAFISAIINFLIIAFVVFCMVKGLNTMRERMDAIAKKNAEDEAAEEAAAPTCPYCLEEVKPGATRCPHCGEKIEA